MLPLPSTNATYVHVRAANLLGSFYESTLKLVYTGCAAAAYFEYNILHPVGQLDRSHTHIYIYGTSKIPTGGFFKTYPTSDISAPKPR